MAGEHSAERDGRAADAHEDHTLPLQPLQVSSHDVAFSTVSISDEQTQQIGVHLGKLVCAGDLILLIGNLGAGKTTFTQGIARGMGIEDVVNSPTFTLLKEYLRPANVTNKANAHGAAVGALALYHFDLYRLDEPDEILDLGFEEYFAGSGVSVVEWAERNDGFWPRERLEVHLALLDQTRRQIAFNATGVRYSVLLRQLQKNSYATTSS